MIQPPWIMFLFILINILILCPVFEDLPPVSSVWRGGRLLLCVWRTQRRTQVIYFLRHSVFLGNHTEDSFKKCMSSFVQYCLKGLCYSISILFFWGQDFKMFTPFDFTPKAFQIERLNWGCNIILLEKWRSLTVYKCGNCQITEGGWRGRGCSIVKISGWMKALNDYKNIK